MLNRFVVKKYVEDKEHQVRGYGSSGEAVLAERGLLLDYPDALFVTQEIDGAGNEVPNREVNPWLTLKNLEAEVRTKLADIIGGAKAITGALENEERVLKIAESIQEAAERINQLFK